MVAETIWPTRPARPRPNIGISQAPMKAPMIADDDVAEQSETVTLDQCTGEPAGDGTN